jgi:hypothetical protein
MPLLRSYLKELLQNDIIEFGLYLAVKPQRGDILVAPAGGIVLAPEERHSYWVLETNMENCGKEKPSHFWYDGNLIGF